MPKTLKPRVQIAPTRQFASIAGATDTRMRGGRWAAIRGNVMRRDCGLCQDCLAAGATVPGVEVDHITPLHMGGTDDLRNLRLLCRACHASKTAREAGDRARLAQSR